MKIEPALDLQYNFAALCIAILREDIATPEQAFAVKVSVMKRLVEYMG